MTIAELIQQLCAFDANASVWVMGGPDCDMPSDPAPELVDSSIYPGVYL